MFTLFMTSIFIFVYFCCIDLNWSCGNTEGEQMGHKEKYYTQEWVDESQPLSHLNFFSVGWRMWTFPAFYEVPHDFLSFFTFVKRSQKMDLSHLWGRGTWRPDSHSMPQFLPEKQYQRDRRHSGATERHSEVEGWGKWHLQVQMLRKSPCI